MDSPTPITPKQRLGTDGEGMQEHTHLTRLRRRTAQPFTLFSQWTRTTAADAGGIDHAQASIPFPASLMGDERLTCRATKGPVWLQSKILTREAARFPGQGHGSWTISLCRRRRSSLFLWRWQSRSKLGRTDGIGSQLMA